MTPRSSGHSPQSVISAVSSGYRRSLLRPSRGLPALAGSFDDPKRPSLTVVLWHLSTLLPRSCISLMLGQMARFSNACGGAIMGSQTNSGTSKLLSGLAAYLFMLACGLLFFSQSSAASERIAFVVAVDDYASLPKLSNPVLDVRRFTRLLEAHGVDVTSLHNPTSGDIQEALAVFGRKARQATEAFIYLAGHGIEEDDNYIVFAKDGSYSCERRAPRNHVRVADILSHVQNVQKIVVIVDACRERPSLSCPEALRGNRVPTRGLGSLGRPGVILVSSTLSSLLASDGKKGEHSPFALSLFKNLEALPSVYLDEILSATSRDLRRTSQQYVEFSVQAAPEMCLRGSKCEDTRTALARLSDESKDAQAPRDEKVPSATTVAPSINSVEEKPKITETAPAPLPPLSKPPTSSSIASNSKAIGLGIQKELARLGCFTGRATGDWGGLTKNAARRFNERSLKKLSSLARLSHYG